ncbi:MAG TPA: class I SAM-dependent methyltransferase, partial [Kofleriaceae bacterium]
MWWQTFFDVEYVRLWTKVLTPERTATEVQQLVDLLDIRRNTRVLDAPCGTGRIARGLAERGAIVLGVDQSADLLAEAERTRGDITEEHLRYMQHDLRNPLEEYDFDVALNIFSSLGYGDEIDDLSILTALAKSLHPRGTLVVETNHRDMLISKLVR